MSKGQLDRDCTNKCASIQHGDNISSVITKRCVTDAELCAFIRWKCSGCGQVNDSMGRNAVHFASSCGRTKLLKWLLTQTQQQNAQSPPPQININAKDLESGYTALHRSIFYGKINAAVALIRLGANIHTLDNDDLSPLDHAMKDRLNHTELSVSAPLCQAYVWGTNTNFTLGTGHQHAKQLPDLHDAFHKKYSDVSVLQVSMSKFHSIIVSREGRVFSCGHGQGGRLGLNTEKTVLIPEEVHFTSSSVSAGAQRQFVCVEAAVGLNHTIFVSDSGQVWACGLNTHHVLGVKPPPAQLLQPTLVGHLPEIRGVCAARFHSVAWSPSVVYTWGLHAGQLGHDRSSNKTYITPKRVSNILNIDAEIVCVAASDGATVVATKKGDIFVFHEYQIRKIASKQLNVEKVVVVGGHLNSKLSHDILVEKGGNDLKVIVLQTTGNLYLWQESWPQLSRCIYSLNRPLIVRDAVLSRTQLFFVTVDGEAFRGEFKTRRKKVLDNSVTTNKTTFHEFLEKDECQMIKVHRYPNVHQAVKIHCDLKGRNFAVIQCAPQFLLVDVPEVSTKTMVQDMLNLLNYSDEMDTIHDAVFKVSGHIFPVHRYIIALKSEQLDSLIESHEMNNEPIELTNIHPIIFKQILLYIYSGTCDVLKCGECTPEIKALFSNCDKSRKKEDMKKYNPVGLVQQAAKRFGVKSLYKKLDSYSYSYDGCNDYIQLKCKQKPTNEDGKFDRRMFKNLHDVLIQSKNGTEMYAHKCVLAARLEYFNNLFALRWNELNVNAKKCTTITLPISHSVLETVVDFLYTDEAKDTDDIDHISNVLVVADQLFIERLKEICEVALSGLLTLRNAAYMLQFSSTYNAVQLKRCAMEFICLNLAAVLETRILEILHDDILNDLTQFYCNWNKVLCSRVITPFSDAPSDETVKSISETYPVSIEELEQDRDDSEDVERKAPKLNSVRKKTRTRTKSSTETSARTKRISEASSTFDENTSFNQDDEQMIENKYTDEKWVGVLSEKEKHKKIIQSRLAVIASAKEMTFEDISHNFQKIVSPLKHPVEPGTSSTIYDIPIKMGQKLSQKQRKKMEEINKCNTSSNININREETLSSSPKNPWQKIEIPSPVVSPKVEENFLNIITDERKQKENWSKMRARPLHYCQMEDKAISDLERFYNIDHVTDECITIHKVEKGVFAVPLWVHNN